MDITVTIKTPDLSGAIQSLADAIVAAFCNPNSSDTQKENQKLLQQIQIPNVPTGGQVPPAQNIAPVQQMPMQQVPTGPVQPQQQTPIQQQPVPTVPTAAPVYTLDQIAQAASNLADAPGHSLNEISNLLTQFGVQALTQLPKEQYGAFATQLRAMGAAI